MPRATLGHSAEVDRLGEHVARVGPFAAELLRRGVEPAGDAAPALCLRDHDLLRLEQALVVAGARDRHRRSEHPMSLRDLAQREAVELPAQRLAVELGDQPADGAREAQVVARALGRRAPAHAARDLQARDEAREQLRDDVARRPPLGLDADDDELGATDHLAPDVLRRGALGTREPGAGLGQRAVVGVGDLGLGAAELLDPGQLLRRHAVDQDGDAARRHEDPRGRALLEQALVAEQRQREAGLLRRALQLPDDRLADFVRQLLAADLDQQPAHPLSPSRPSPTTSRYRPATLRARSRTRAI